MAKTAEGQHGGRRDLEARVSALESLARIHAAITDLATRCASAKPDHLDATITAALANVGDALNIDRCTAHLPVADAPAFKAAWRWVRAGCRMPSGDFDATVRLPWLTSRARSGETVRVATLSEIPDHADRDSLVQLGAQACVVMPLGNNESRGALVVETTSERNWSDEAIGCLHLIAAVIGQAAGRRSEREQLTSASTDVKRRGPQPLPDQTVLHRDALAVRTDRKIASESAAICQVLAQVEQVAPTTATVLLLGETGVGKEVFAQALHNLSPRYRRPMISVSCAAIPKELIESELFGREPGAFTGAVSRQIGRFEAANGSTIFLDEIGDLPLEIQVKLLRVLQERSVERLGGNHSVKVDVRVIAATNRNLERAVADNTFREDLFYRLNVFPIAIPPLRERIEDIPSLVWTFIEEFSQTFGKKIDSISKESLAALQRYPWPGNVRELRNVIEREMIVATGPTLTVTPPASPVSVPRRAESAKLEDVQAEHITSVLESCRWRVRGTGGAADRLGVKPTTLESRMARLGISRQSRQLSA
jgi:transcriptional regulator with GAF, ATPase, and Fis domain